MNQNPDITKRIEALVKEQLLPGKLPVEDPSVAETEPVS